MPPKETSSFTGSLELNTRTQRKMPPVFYWFVEPTLAVWNLFKWRTKMFQSPPPQKGRSTLSPTKKLGQSLIFLHGSLGNSLLKRHGSFQSGIRTNRILKCHGDAFWHDPTYRLSPLKTSVKWRTNWIHPWDGNFLYRKTTKQPWEANSAMICKTLSCSQFTRNPSTKSYQVKLFPKFVHKGIHGATVSIIGGHSNSIKTPKMILIQTISSQAAPNLEIWPTTWTLIQRKKEASRPFKHRPSWRLKSCAVGIHPWISVASKATMHWFCSLTSGKHIN